MKKINLFVVLFFILIIGLVIAIPKGGLPELWESVDMISQRVSFLEQIGNNTNQGLFQRVAQLENQIAFLTQQVQILQNNVEDLQNSFDGIRNLPIDIGIVSLDFGDVTIQQSPLTFDDYLNGVIEGDLIVLIQQQELHPILINNFVNCNIGNGVFVNDRSNTSKGLTRNYTRSINISVFSQFQNWTAVRAGNFSCVPTVTGVAIQYWNKSLPSLARNMSLYNISNTLHRLMRTNSRNGTTLNGFLVGLTRWINSTGYTQNITITIRGNSVGDNTSFKGNGVNITTITGTGSLFNPLTIDMIIEEFFTKEEFVILVIEVPGGFHVVAIHSMSNTPNPDGTYDVALMDPATGEIIETTIERNGNICIEWQGDRCIRATTLQDIWSISLKDA